MSGGGDTPEKTQFAISIDENNSRYAAGYVQNKIAYVYSEDEDSVMLMDASGKYSNLVPLENYKEQFISKISSDVEPVEDIGYSKVEGINIGDDLPDWDNIPKYNW